ncbi:hypothetical protein [Natrinema longum]|uniref:hypothetical protein n=1 Tax=Natrinema longum TaxID=370324 RepID=UPI001CCEF651|nr:hypothetical protein [Natrinema longum]MBZ6494951.1 hypothetical protein [Natrinema longum]
MWVANVCDHLATRRELEEPVARRLRDRFRFEAIDQLVVVPSDPDVVWLAVAVDHADHVLGIRLENERRVCSTLDVGRRTPLPVARLAAERDLRSGLDVIAVGRRLALVAGSVLGNRGGLVGPTAVLETSRESRTRRRDAREFQHCSTSDDSSVPDRYAYLSES